MTRDEIIRMAREAGVEFYPSPTNEVRLCLLKNLERFAALVAAAEREACAKECETLRPSKPEYDQRFYDGCTFSAHAIRARGQG